MIFTLITTLKESVESLIADRINTVEAEKDREAREAEERENAKFYGEKVTRERFLHWREEFRRQQTAQKAEEEQKREEESGGARGTKIAGGGSKGGKEERRLTGRELWEKGLVGKGEEVEDNAGGDAKEKDALVGVQHLQVND